MITLNNDWVMAGCIIIVGIIFLWRVYANLPEEEASESGGVNQL